MADGESKFSKIEKSSHHSLASFVGNQQKEKIIEKLREKGCRITQQRLVLLDVILNHQCASCKEMYALALKQDAKIGIATVYRMVNTLEEIGAINRRNMYRIHLTENS